MPLTNEQIERIVETLDREIGKTFLQAEALEPFARYYDLNDCAERRPDDAIEVPIMDLRAAAAARAKVMGES